MFLLLMIPVTVAAIAFEAWMIMLLIGVIHHEWLTMMPTIGYWSAVKICTVSLFTVGSLYGLAQAMKN